MIRIARTLLGARYAALAVVEEGRLVRFIPDVLTEAGGLVRVIPRGPARGGTADPAPGARNGPAVHWVPRGSSHDALVPRGPDPDRRRGLRLPLLPREA